MAGITHTATEYTGLSGRVYAFYSIATDKVGHVEAAPQSPDTQTTVNAFSWHNLEIPLDVNGDRHVVPGDALIVINELNGRRKIDWTGKLPLRPPADAKYHYEVNGDGYCTSADALWIINYLHSIVHPAGEALSPAEENWAFAVSFPEAACSVVDRTLLSPAARSDRITAGYPVEPPRMPPLTARVPAVQQRSPVRGTASPGLDGLEDVLDALAADAANLKRPSTPFRTTQ